MCLQIQEPPKEGNIIIGQPLTLLLFSNLVFLFEALFWYSAIISKPCMVNYAVALTIKSWPSSTLTVKLFIKENNEHNNEKSTTQKGNLL
jgi:hypothetical protein